MVCMGKHSWHTRFHPPKKFLDHKAVGVFEELVHLLQTFLLLHVHLTVQQLVEEDTKRNQASVYVLEQFLDSFGA